MTVDTDLLIIGGGAGGISAAQTAARRGAGVVLVQDGRVGGECTFTGCVPSKSLLASAAAGTGFAAAMADMRRQVELIAAREDDRAMAAQGIAVRHGRAAFTAPGTVVVDGVAIRSRRVVIATGSAPMIPSIDGAIAGAALTNESIFHLDRLPASMAIVGGGAIGVEMAQAFARFGTKVTLVEGTDRLLPAEEPEASAVVARALQAAGVDVRTSCRPERTEPDGAVTRMHLSGGGSVIAEQVLVAVGRRPVTAGLGLEEIGMALNDRGFITTDSTLRTTVAGHWAVGDVTGRSLFTHAAARMGMIAAANALNRTRRIRAQRFRSDTIPRVTFTDPEVAHVGMSEAEAAGCGGRVAHVPFAEFDRAVTAGRTDGYLKLIAGPRPVIGNAGGGRVLGATIVGPTAGEMIHEIALAIETGMFAGRLAQTVHAYPTWSVAIQIAAAQLFFDVDGRGHRPARL